MLPPFIDIMMQMKYLMIFFLSSLIVFSCKKNNKIDEGEIITSNNIKEDESIIASDSIVNTLTSLDINYKPTQIDKQTWISVQFLKSLYQVGINHVDRNQETYPFESIYIENWKGKKIYAESAGLDYRKIRVEPLNDTTYYITKWNKHHYAKTDSIFIVKRNNEISIITKNDSIPYTSGLGNYPFKEIPLNKNIHYISFYNKTFNMFNSDGLKMEDSISFDLSKNKVVNSLRFRNFNFTEYYLNNDYALELDSIMYFFRWNGNKVFFESKTGKQFILKQTQDL